MRDCIYYDSFQIDNEPKPICNYRGRNTYCECDGCESNCEITLQRTEDASREYRRPALTTAQMWLDAQHNNQLYRSECMCYSAAKGFYSMMDGESWPANAFNLVDEIFDISDWEVVKTMTRTEAEAKLNCVIVD